MWWSNIISLWQTMKNDIISPYVFRNPEMKKPNAIKKATKTQEILMVSSLFFKLVLSWKKDCMILWTLRLRYSCFWRKSYSIRYVYRLYDGLLFKLFVCVESELNYVKIKPYYKKYVKTTEICYERYWSESIPCMLRNKYCASHNIKCFPLWNVKNEKSRGIIFQYLKKYILLFL